MTKTAPDLPSVVRVGAVRYAIVTDADRITAVSDEQQLDNGEWIAYSDHNALIIALNPAHAADAQRHSLVHEVLHCCIRQSGAEPDAYARTWAEANEQGHGIDVEEYTVAATAGPLLSVLRDNPDLLAWLTSD